MQRVYFLSLVFLSGFANKLSAQNILPDITVNNINGQIVVSWINSYKTPVTTINIQRSFDSLKNYTTIGSVLNPQNIENGYADIKPPYNKMYYRVFVSFDGGTYIFSKIERPVKEIMEITNTPDSNFPFLKRDYTAIQPKNDPKIKNYKIQPKNQLPSINTKTEIITYPSSRIFTGKENNVILYLPEAGTKKYSVKFFEENDSPLFELTKIHEQFLIIEKVNFAHAGWFHFEVYENGKLIEKNKFYISKDGKNPQHP